MHIAIGLYVSAMCKKNTVCSLMVDSQGPSELKPIKTLYTQIEINH